jgi:hypothetical protein
VYTLQEFYASVNRLAPAGSTPRPGDVMLWGPDGPMGLHANIVIAAVDGTVHLLGYGGLD